MIYIFSDQLSDVKALEIRFHDTQKNASPYIPYDGVPYCILGKKMLECHHGYDRDVAKKKKWEERSKEVWSFCVSCEA